MIRNELLSIAEHFSAYDVRFSDEEDGFDIVNPFGKDPIRVYVEDDPREPYTVGFPSSTAISPRLTRRWRTQATS